MLGFSSDGELVGNEGSAAKGLCSVLYSVNSYVFGSTHAFDTRLKRNALASFES